MPIVIPVKFAFAAHDLWFDPVSSGAEAGDHVVCETERGLEFGLVTADAFEVPEEELGHELKPLVRVASDDDIDLAEKLADKGDEALPVFRKYASDLELDMKPIAVEFLFSEDKAIFYFTAEDRVDFRQLVKDLSAYFHVRIDMRQIGVRDETRLIGGYAHCGQELCCCRFGGQFEPVSIRMAKEQDLPLNSAKISGVCGRLMCCLRYEFEAYKDFKNRAPKKKQLIDTPLGKAKIIEYDTPREMLRLRLENGKQFCVNLADMTCSSEACCKAKENGCTCRPDTVMRETLDAIESPDIALALLELDRENGISDDDDVLSEADRIQTTSPTRARAERSRARRDERRRKNDDAQSTQDSSADKRSNRSSRKGSDDSQQSSRTPRRRSSSEKTAANARDNQTSSSRRRRHMSATDREAAFVRAAGSTQDSKKSETPKDAQAPKSTRSHRTHKAASSNKNAAAHTESASAEKNTQQSSRRRHKTADGKTLARTTQTKNAAIAKKGNNNNEPRRSTKAATPSVAEQVATSEVKVTRRRPGDRGGSQPAENSTKSSSETRKNSNRRSRRTHKSAPKTDE